MRSYTPLWAGLCALITVVTAHGSHAEKSERPKEWALWHLREEHHIDNFDAPSFFTLHDFNSDGYWTQDEVRLLYGLDDESLKDTPEQKKDEAVKKVFELFDPSHSETISRKDFVEISRKGVKLPDFGLGPGHHGDDEYEYEIHHFEKFHSGDDVTEDDLNHPEDIEHFRKHDQMEDEEERIEEEQSHGIVEHNIPMKFRRHG